MQFPHTIVVVYQSLNEFAEEEATKESPMRCRIIDHSRAVKREQGARTKRYDMKIIASHGAYAPYADLFKRGQLLNFRYDDILYEPTVVGVINDFSGKVKYYEIDMDEKR